jgi:hypothetical protein
VQFIYLFIFISSQTYTNEVSGVFRNSVIKQTFIIYIVMFSQLVKNRGFQTVVGPPSEKHYSVGPHARPARGGEEQNTILPTINQRMLLLQGKPSLSDINRSFPQFFEAHAVTDARTATLRILDISLCTITPPPYSV